jgi:hypothetical protein
LAIPGVRKSKNLFPLAAVAAISAITVSYSKRKRVKTPDIVGADADAGVASSEIQERAL